MCTEFYEKQKKCKFYIESECVKSRVPKMSERKHNFKKSGPLREKLFETCPTL
jgi:hypothetical protein